MKVNAIERLNSITKRVTALDIVIIYNNLHATETILYINVSIINSSKCVIA